MSNTALTRVRKIKTGRPSAKQILTALADHADDTGRCFPSIKALTAETELSRSTIQRELKYLVERGFVRREARTRTDGGRGSDAYVLILDQTAEATATSHPDDPQCHTDTPPPHSDTPPCHDEATPCHPGGGPRVTQGGSILEASVEASKEARAPAAPFADVLHELWAEGPTVLMQLGISEGHARRMIGKWLKDTKDDPVRVYDAIKLARQKRTGDPIPFITGALKVSATTSRRQTSDDATIIAFERAFERSRARPRTVDNTMTDAEFAAAGGIR